MRSLILASLDELCLMEDHILRNLSHYKAYAPENYAELEAYIRPRYFKVLNEFERRDETVYARIYHIMWTTLKAQELGRELVEERT